MADMPQKDTPKGTAIPRLSKLPRPPSTSRPTSALPRPASILRPSPSRESLAGPATTGIRAGGTELRNPKLRSAASIDQLRTGQSTTPRNPRLRTSLSRDQLRSSTQGTAGSPTPRSSRPPPLSGGSTSRAAAAPSRRPSTTFDPIPDEETQPEESSGESNGVLFKRRLTLTRRPSETFSISSLQDMIGRNDEDLPRTSESSEGPDTVRKRSLKPRPSLSERTMETLAGIPSSPALSRSGSSSFFDGNQTRQRSSSRASRPGSSYSSDERAPSRGASRPGSSGRVDNYRASTYKAPANVLKTPLTPIKGTPESRQLTKPDAKTPSLRKSTSRASLSTISKLPSTGFVPLGENSRSPPVAKKSYAMLPPKTSVRTVASKPNKPLLRKPSVPALDGSSWHSPWDGTIQPADANSSTNAGSGNDTHDDVSPSSYRKSSAALRDQIAQAKAAKRAAARQPPTMSNATVNQDMPIVPSDTGFDFGVHEDPFNLRRNESSSKKVLQQRISAARTTGRLNIAALNLKEIPVDVTKMYDLESIGPNDASWAESVDLTRLVAADNELEKLDDKLFPDSSPQSLEDEAEEGHIFGGLETLDLHGNLLIELPIGLRQLTLTSLNLVRTHDWHTTPVTFTNNTQSSNRLMNECLSVIGQVTTLRDLKLAKNLFLGPLRDLSGLKDLEILDLQGNTISALPHDIHNMTRLRILNLNENSISWLPFQQLAQLPLTELLVRKNKLNGTLIEEGVTSLPQLQTLDASANQLTRLVPLGSTIILPELHVLSLSMNKLQGLPDMTSWSNLLTLTVDENSMSGIPNSFMTLQKLRHADFSSNDIRVIPPEIARMTNLSLIRLSGNPLRDKKFVSKPTDELKEALAARLEPPPPYQEPGALAHAVIPDFVMGTKPDSDSKAGASSRKDEPDDDSRSDDDFATPPTSAPHSPSRSRSQTASSLRSRSMSQVWPIKHGLLDRSSTELSTLHPVICSKVAAEQQVTQVHLQHNLFSSIPNSLSFFADTLTSLSLASNHLLGQTYLVEDLEFPKLKELNLSSNRVTSLEPLLMHLQAPSLEKLDISLNRVNALPVTLREVFPALSILLASNNQLVELDPETIRGLKIVDATNNDISHLNPRIGLLGGAGGLERLDVMGNRFRVPRWNVLERGTESTLRWLRSRVPVAEMATWKGDEDEETCGEVD